MMLLRLGTIGQHVVVDPAVTLISPHHLAVITSWRGVTTAKGIQFHLADRTMEVDWTQDITSNSYHMWSGFPLKWNPASALLVTPDCLFLAGGSDRLLVNPETGVVHVRVSGIGACTARASQDGTRILVVEGQYLAEYDQLTLDLLRREPIPGGFWAFTSPVSGVLPIEEESYDHTALWLFDRNLVWPLPEARIIRGTPLIGNRLIVVPLGTGAPNGWMALDVETGVPAWSVDSPRAEPQYPMSDAPEPFLNPGWTLGDEFLAATASPALLSIGMATGSIRWQIDLPSQPTAIGIVRDAALIGLEDGSIIAIDAQTGERRGDAKLFGEDVFPISIVPLPDADGVSSAVVIARRGACFHIVPDLS